MGSRRKFTLMIIKAVHCCSTTYNELVPPLCFFSGTYHSLTLASTFCSWGNSLCPSHTPPLISRYLMERDRQSVTEMIVCLGLAQDEFWIGHVIELVMIGSKEA
jgi:hypothetical protein